MTPEIQAAIKSLVEKAGKETGGEAMKLSQAALNLAHVAAMLHDIQRTT